MEEKEFITINIPRKAYAIKNDEVYEVVFRAGTECMTEWYFSDAGQEQDEFFLGHFVYAKELNKVLFLGANAKRNAEDYLQQKLKRKRG